MNKDFVTCFRKAIDIADPIANSLMSKDMPPSVKILADWGRKACKELDTTKEALKQCETEREIDAKIVVGLYKELDKLKTQGRLL